MAQFDFGTMDPDQIDGTELTNILNQWRNALHGSHKGTAAPTYAVLGMHWLDDSDTPWELKRCTAVDEVTWVTEGYIDPSGPTFTPASHGHPIADVTGLQAVLNGKANTEDIPSLPLSVANGGTGATSAAAARTALGLAVGSDVEAHDPDILKADVAATRTARHPGTVNELAIVDGEVDIDATAGDVYDLVLDQAAQLNCPTLAGDQTSRVVVTGSYALPLAGFDEVDSAGEASDPASGARELIVYSVGAERWVLITTLEAY
mgnify:CR=1 FL=1